MRHNDNRTHRAERDLREDYGPRNDSDREGEGLRDDRSGRVHKDFSAYNREINQQIDPDTQDRIVLLTKKQLMAKLLKELREF